MLLRFRLLPEALETLRIEPHPALDNLAIGPPPGLVRIGPEHEVQVVGHDGVGAGPDGEDLNELPETIIDPGPSVLPLIATEKGPTHAAADTVVVTRCLGIDEETARVPHHHPPAS